MTSLADRLRQIRSSLGLSQREMAKHLEIPAGTYQDHELGKSPQKFAILERLKDRGYSLDWLFSGDGTMMIIELKPAGLSEAIAPFSEHQPNGIRFNEELLKVVVTKIEQLLARERRQLPPEKKAELVIAVYMAALDMAAKLGTGVPIDDSNVVRLIRLAG